jgi:hypothetical protein
MATLPEGIHGTPKGKLGTIIGSSWKGKPYIKVRSRKRTKKRSDEEKYNQDKFATLHEFLRPLLIFLRAGFKGYDGRLEGYNAAKSYNLKNAFTGEPGKQQLDPSKILVSYGNLPVPEIRCEVIEKEFHFTWEPASLRDQGGDDQVMMLVYNPEKSSSGRNWNTTGQLRKTGKDVLRSPGPGNYHVWAAFNAHDRSRQSNSVYLGVVSVP